MGCRPHAKPDVVVVLVDTLRADHLGYMGYARPTSPNLDALARDSVVFRHAISASTWTKPAVASLFTGLYPSEHGILGMPRSPKRAERMEHQILPPTQPTLAERFRAGGYATIAAVHQPNLTEQGGFSRGFDVYERPHETDDFALLARFLQEIDQAPTDRPLFGYLHLLDVHWPYAERLPSLPIDAFGATDPKYPVAIDRSAVRESRRNHWRGLDLGTLEALYDHGVAWDDRVVGDLVEALRSRQRWRKTVFVVVADHGEGFLEHHLLEHSYEPYRELTHIPLLMHLPAGWSVKPGERQSVVSLAGLGPTLLELAGLPSWPGATARSFADIARGRERPDSFALIEMYRARAIRTQSAKLILERRGRLLYFDLTHDPREKKNLAQHHGCDESCRQLVAMLRRMDDRLRPPLNHTDSAVRIDPEDIAKLRDLGYL